MKTNDPDFLANVLEAVYDEDPLGFEIKKAWMKMTEAITNASLSFLNCATAADDLSQVIKVARRTMKAVFKNNLFCGEEDEQPDSPID